jgi:hypothetical protein
VRNKGGVNGKYADGKDMQHDGVIVTDGEVGLVNQAHEGGGRDDECSIAQKRCTTMEMCTSLALTRWKLCDQL